MKGPQQSSICLWKKSITQLAFEKLETSINVLAFMIMESHGDRRDNSRVEVIATSSSMQMLLIVLEGFHDSNTSVTYSYEHPLEYETQK